MVDPVIGQSHTQHTAYPLPLLLMGEDDASLRAGCGLSDVAPTVLDLLGLPQSAEMTGRRLILPTRQICSGSMLWEKGNAMARIMFRLKEITAPSCDKAPRKPG